MVINFIEDKFNKLNKRNKSNTKVFDYNCAGFALNIFSWYAPYSKDVSPIIFSDGYKTISEEETMRITINKLLEDFKSLRIINNIGELKENEYAIAYRFGKEDFHFIKRNKKGEWFEKIGEWGIYEIQENAVLNEFWGDEKEYNSKLTLFAKECI